MDGLFFRFRRNRGLASSVGLGIGFHIVPQVNGKPKPIMSHDNRAVIKCPKGHQLLATRAAVEESVALHRKFDSAYVLLPPAIGTHPEPDPPPNLGVRYNGKPLPGFTPNQIVLRPVIDWSE